MTKTITIGLLALGLSACNSNSAPGNDRRADLESPPEAAPQENAASALANAAPGSLYPGILTEADVASIGGTGGRCVFRMDRVGYPTFVYGGTKREGTLKLNGKLVMIPATEDQSFTGEGLTVEMREGEGSDDEATMVVRISGASNELGFRGFSNCAN